MNKKKILISLILVLTVVLVGGYFLSGNKQTESSATSSKIEIINYAQSTDSLDDPYLGNKDSKIVIVEFADFECPYCQQEFSIIREVANLYPQIKIVFRDLPLVSIHKNALTAAIAASCANKQNKFWQYHDQLYLNQSQFSADFYELLAKRIGLNTDLFSECLKDESIKEEIVKDVTDANNMGVDGTPTFFVNGKKIAGVISIETWKQIIAVALTTIK